MQDAVSADAVEADPRNKLLDAFNAVVYQDHDLEMEIEDHIESILKHLEFEVRRVEVNIQTAEVSAQFWINGRWRRIYA